MKRILVLSLVVLGVVAFAATASAQNMLGTLELNGAYSKSSTEVGTSTDTMGGGLGFGAAYWRGISPQISWGAEVGYENLGSVDETTTDPILLTTSTTKISGSVFRINPAFRYNFGTGVGPNFYAQAGAGLYSVSGKVEDATTGVSTSDSQSKLGLNFGAGVGFPMGPKTRLHLQGNYHTVSTDGTSTNYVTFNAGIGFGL